MLVPATKAAPGDPKAALHQLCQRMVKRPMTKQDVEYSVAQYGAQFQATVKLNCLHGEAYAGQLEKNSKDAEKSAAQHALADLDPTYKIQPLATIAPAAGTVAPPALSPTGLPPQNADPKSELNQFCQRFTKRPITKADIVYTTTKHGAQYQSCVQLNCLSGQEYAGHLMSSAKEAEKSAAEQALTAHAADIAALPATTTKRKAKSGTTGEVGELGAVKKAKTGDADGANSCITPKSQLNALAMKLAKRALKKGETVYECLQVEGGYQATVALSALPGEYGGVVWAGQVCPTKQAAEQSAAEIAYGQLSSDPTVAPEITAPAKPQGMKGSGKGKWGKMDMAWAMMGGMGMGMKQQDLPRQRVGEDVLTGEVLSWMGHYGWIKPEVAIERESAKMRDGRVYVNKKDVSAGTMAKGAKVSFKLFEDPSGLGAEEVSVTQEAAS